jgi:hypothetical protein
MRVNNRIRQILRVRRVSPNLLSLADSQFDFSIFGEISILKDNHRLLTEIDRHLSDAFAVVMKPIDLCEHDEFCQIEQESDILNLQSFQALQIQLILLF